MYLHQHLHFVVGHTSQPARPPERFVPATVPGAVQLDWAVAEGWTLPEYNTHLNVRYTMPDAVILTDYEWMEDVYWLYRARLDFEPPVSGQRLFLITAVDYQFEIRLDGRVIHTQEGMFTPVELDLTDLAHPGDTLEILVNPAPKIYSEPVNQKQPMQSCKPAFSYGWDFHPRLIPLGIWQETYLETRPTVHLRRAEVSYDLADDFRQAAVRLEAALSQPGHVQVKWTVLDPQGVPVLEQITGILETDALVSLSGELVSPELWWPNEQGAPALYQSQVDLMDDEGRVLDSRQSAVGFRRIRLVNYEGHWNDFVSTSPLSCENPPTTLDVNGRQIFGKGSNWVGPDMFPGRVNIETYRPLLQLAHDSHFNLLRCWGGAPVQKESFFDLCDQLGLMVWQEFPLACGRYEGTPAYLRVLDQESQSIIRRLRSHPCLALWCGGNELFSAWSDMNDQDLALRLLNRNCYDLDPQRPYLMTSPMPGMAHGNYLFRLPDGDEVFQYFPRAKNTAYTEFGVPGPANADLLHRIIPPEELFPPRMGTHWQHRHAMGAWDGSSGSWLELACQEHYFGQPENLEQVVARGQWLQAEGLKSIFEEARRQKPRCAMALNWCFNEPWPCAANSSLISWPAEPKPALAAVRAALRPVLASARLPKFAWQAGETFTAELFLLNDSPQAFPDGRLEAWLRNPAIEESSGADGLMLGEWMYPEIAANTNLPGPTLQVTLPALKPGPLRLVLRVPEHPDWDSEYVFLNRPD